MSKGPEANFWNTLRANLPKKCVATRIENKHGGGVPDVHILWDGLPFWLELKVSKGNTVRLSPHQVAWNTAYWARGGANFILVKHHSSSLMYLFDGMMSSDLSKKFISEVQGSVFESPAALFRGLRPCVLARYEQALRPCDPAG